MSNYRRSETPSVYGEPVDIGSFLSRPLLARVATDGPTLRPVWYVFEGGVFYWLTDTSNFLCKAVQRGQRLVVVVDECDIHTGEVVHVRARGYGKNHQGRPGESDAEICSVSRLGRVAMGFAVRSIPRPAVDTDVPLRTVISGSCRRVLRGSSLVRTRAIALLVCPLCAARAGRAAGYRAGDGFPLRAARVGHSDALA